MRIIATAILIAVAAASFGQSSHYVKGRKHKDGTSSPPHWTTPKSHGQHKERRWVRGYTKKNGEVVEGHWTTVWVDN